MKVERWAITYADGSRFTSDDGTWAEAPAFGVFAVVYYDVSGKRLVQMEQCDDSRYRAIFEGIEAAGNPVKYGLWVDNDTYHALFDAVHGEVVS